MLVHINFGRHPTTATINKTITWTDKISSKLSITNRSLVFVLSIRCCWLLYICFLGFALAIILTIIQRIFWNIEKKLVFLLMFSINSARIHHDQGVLIARNLLNRISKRNLIRIWCAWRKTIFKEKKRSCALEWTGTSSDKLKNAQTKNRIQARNQKTVDFVFPCVKYERRWQQRWRSYTKCKREREVWMKQNGNWIKRNETKRNEIRNENMKGRQIAAVVAIEKVEARA